MRRIILFIAVFSALCTTAWTQSVPMGMKYQAVARDLKGNVLGNQEISIRITLYSDLDRQTTEYSESHTTATNEVGLFTLVIGEGSILAGTFDKVPWSTRDIWMEVSVLDKKSSEFVSISSSKLLAVPYAFHAGTASQLIYGENRSASQNGVPANVWSLFGNSDTDPDEDNIGTTDCADFVFITNNIERLRITCAGVVNIVNDLNVGANLDVGIDAHIGNDLTVDQDVFLNVDGGNTTVNGDLTVANMSPTLLTGTLTVDKATDLNSTLNVDGTTDLNDDLTVTGMSSTLLTGTLTVDKATDLNSTLNVDGTTDLNDDLTVTGMSSTLLTGTLTVDKATDLNSTLNVDGTTDLNDDLTVTGMSSTLLTGTLEVDKATTLHNTLAVDGATVLNSTLTTTGVTTLNNTLNVNGSSSYVANFVNSTSSNGISIQVEEGTPSTSNNFVTFKNGGGGTVGRIEGQTGAELLTSFDYIWFTTMEALHTAFAAALIVVDLIGVDDFDAAVVEGAELATAIAEWLEASINLALNVGVVYESGSGDYAEWLEREYGDEVFSYGDIVGVKGGKISKNMENADRYMVISQNPIVLGNMPPADDKSYYEMVAFMGQVPVKVRGEVEIGDYIIASDLLDGFGVAVSPDDITLDQYEKIVGIAWTAFEGEKAFSMINVAVGINTNDVVDKLKKQQAELDDVKMAMNNVISYLQSRDPSFDASVFSITPEQRIVNSEPSTIGVESAEELPYNGKMAAIAKVLEKNPEMIDGVLADARVILDEKGIDYNRFEQTSRLLNDRNYLISMLMESK